MDIIFGCVEPGKPEGNDRGDGTKDGDPKILKECTLPPTGADTVSQMHHGACSFRRG
jgi:hypothetical protein